jgi:hypothetical protein
VEWHFWDPIRLQPAWDGHPQLFYA